jgi:16S rRNA (cytosine967-C5)-methyltransferase
MIPAARHQAAIEILDRILAGHAAEQALTSWARANRFAGSKDRAAIRDLVFDALRCKRSYAHLGGAETGRGLILGSLRASGSNLGEVFSGTGHAPAPLSAQEAAYVPPPMPETTALDCPDWLAQDLQDSLGTDFGPIMLALRQRAPVFLRVNLARCTRAAAAEALAAQAIETMPHPMAETALEVRTNARAIHASTAYLEGLVELQDAASQAVIAAMPVFAGMRALDYCAGGGGKSLALAARGASVSAHDAAPARMRDLPARAQRAGVAIAITAAPKAGFDLVVTDVPCSGSGSWRRSPDAKWRLTPARLEELTRIQADILRKARALVATGGALAYVTCSLLARENSAQITSFLQNAPEFVLETEIRLTPLDGGDGFYLAVLRDTSQKR